MSTSPELIAEIPTKAIDGVPPITSDPVGIAVERFNQAKRKLDSASPEDRASALAEYSAATDVLVQRRTPPSQRISSVHSLLEHHSGSAVDPILSGGSKNRYFAGGIYVNSGPKKARE